MTYTPCPSSDPAAAPAAGRHPAPKPADPPPVPSPRALAAACERFSDAAREFEEYHGGYAERLADLQKALHAFEVASLAPGDEHVDDYNARLHMILATPGLAERPTAARLRAYLSRSRDRARAHLPRTMGMDRCWWSIHHTYEAGHELWVFVRDVGEPAEDAGSCAVILPPAGAEGTDADVDTALAIVARAEGRHPALVLCDVIGPGCDP